MSKKSTITTLIFVIFSACLYFLMGTMTCAFVQKFPKFFPYLGFIRVLLILIIFPFLNWISDKLTHSLGVEFFKKYISFTFLYFISVLFFVPGAVDKIFKIFPYVNIAVDCFQKLITMILGVGGIYIMIKNIEKIKDKKNE